MILILHLDYKQGRKINETKNIQSPEIEALIIHRATSKMSKLVIWILLKPQSCTKMIWLWLRIWRNKKIKAMSSIKHISYILNKTQEILKFWRQNLISWSNRSLIKIRFNIFENSKSVLHKITHFKYQICLLIKQLSISLMMFRFFKTFKEVRSPLF